MDNVQCTLFFIVLFSFLYTPTKQSIHMYQQNRYQLLRYATWLKQQLFTNRKEKIITMCCLFLSYGLFLVDHEHLPAILLLLLMMVYSYVFFRMEELSEYRKPLVFTHRVKRLFIASYLLYSIEILIALALFPFTVWIALVPFLYLFPWVALFVVALLMKPLEEQIRLHFIKDARKTLDACKGLRIVGITGSYGKTSVKTILNTILSDTYYTLMTPQSYNNLMGITLTIRTKLQYLHEVFLCEMGADHVHEIEHLMDFVQPQYGIVTAVGPQHLSTFRSMENILHEKMQMIEKLPKDGIGVLNYDNTYIRSYSIQNTCKILWYGKSEDCDYQAQDIHYSKKGSTFKIFHQGVEHAFTTRLLGEHNIMNITAAVALAHAMQVPWGQLIKQVASLEYVEHRLQLREQGSYTILDDAYNSNPEGAHYALEVLKQMEGKRIIVTPGFLDLGIQEKTAHQIFAHQIAESVDEVILVGKLQTRDIVQGLREAHFPLRHLHVVTGIQEAFTLLQTLADKDTTVLLENDLPDAFNH